MIDLVFIKYKTSSKSKVLSYTMVHQELPMLTSPPELIMTSNFVESMSFGSSTTTDLRQDILQLEGCSDFENGVINAIPVRQYIHDLYTATYELHQPEMQTLFVQTITGILLNLGLPIGAGRRVAKDGQVEAIKRVVYRLGDTILLARTGYGKSIVFQAVSTILPRKITIQIVPLSKLGEEQCGIIATFPNTRPILIDQSLVKVSQV
jgi:hypothetical protein